MDKIKRYIEITVVCLFICFNILYICDVYSRYMIYKSEIRIEEEEVRREDATNCLRIIVNARELVNKIKQSDKYSKELKIITNNNEINSNMMYLIKLLENKR